MNRMPTPRFWWITARASRESRIEEGEAPQVVVHEGHRGAVDGHVAAGRAHGDAGVARGQGGRVVDPVADHGHAVAVRLHPVARSRPCLRAGTRPGTRRRPTAAATFSATEARSPVTMARRLHVQFAQRLDAAAWPPRGPGPAGRPSRGSGPARATQIDAEPLGLGEPLGFELVPGHPVALQPGGAADQDGRRRPPCRACPGRPPRGCPRPAAAPRRPRGPGRSWRWRRGVVAVTLGAGGGVQRVRRASPLPGAPGGSRPARPVVRVPVLSKTTALMPAGGLRGRSRS